METEEASVEQDEKRSLVLLNNLNVMYYYFINNCAQKKLVSQMFIPSPNGKKIKSVIELTDFSGMKNHLQRKGENKIIMYLDSKCRNLKQW